MKKIICNIFRHDLYIQGVDNSEVRWCWRCRQVWVLFKSMKNIVIEDKLNLDEYKVFEIDGEDKILKAIYSTRDEAEIAKYVLERGGDLKSLFIYKK